MGVITKTNSVTMRRERSTGGGGRGMRALSRSFVRCLRAAVAVELALLAPVLMLMLIGVIDFGGAVYERMQLTSAARAGVQFASQSADNVDDAAGILQAVQNAGSLDAPVTITTTQFCSCAADGAAATCGDTCSSGAPAGTYVMITVVEQYKTIFSYPGLGNPITLEGEVVYRVK